MSNDLEQQRRNLIRHQRPLYDYITAVEQARAYDAGGDLASGASSGEGAANRLWRRAGDIRRLAEVQQERSQVRHS